MISLSLSLDNGNMQRARLIRAVRKRKVANSWTQRLEARGHSATSTDLSLRIRRESATRPLSLAPFDDVKEEIKVSHQRLQDTPEKKLKKA